MSEVSSQPLEAGLCSSCRYVREIVSARGSRFYYCGRSEIDPDYRKYPQLPVRECRGYQVGNDEAE